MSENNKNSKNTDGAIEAAGLDWLDDTIPVSTRFDDPYYSKTDGLAETRHVFLKGNDLPRRWTERQHFTIAELGFGTGLNFLATLHLWEVTGPPGAMLHYISFERYPMSADALLHALSRWPELEQYASDLSGEWNPDTNPFHFRSDGIEAVVHFADANERLPGLAFQADAWFLDGFAPAKNPDLWSVELMAQVFDRTGPGGTFATYTAAGWVRRNLQAAGFEVQRVKGHANKREMLIGCKPIEQ